MDLQPDVAPGGSEQIAVATPANESLSPSEAARLLSERRWKRSQEQEQPAPEPSVETAEIEAAPPEGVPGETTEEAEPAALPPIEPPRSWTKDEKEEFLTYPREAQEKIARREQERETAIRRSQNEAAEKLKGLTAKEQAAEQARQQYEAALPALLETLTARLSGEFADIKSISDVQKLATDDPFRFAQYQAKQMEIASVQREVQQSQERQSQDFAKKWSDFASKEDQTFAERVPEMADPAKAKQISESAIAVLRDLEFTDQELAKLWNGEASISLRDHRLQLLIRDAVRLREAQKLASKPTPKPAPAVQRPGTAPAKGQAQQTQIKQLEQRLDSASGTRAQIMAAAALRAAKRAASQ